MSSHHVPAEDYQSLYVIGLRINQRFIHKKTYSGATGLFGRHSLYNSWFL